MSSSEFKVICDFGPLSTVEAGARGRIDVLNALKVA